MADFDLKINDPKAGSFTMPWASTTPPTSAEIDDYIAKNVTPKSLPVRAWEAANKPLLPEVKGSPLDQTPTLEGSEYRVKHPVSSFITDAGQEMANRAYEKVIRPMSSPLGVGITAATSLSGIPELAPYVRPPASVGLGVLAAKGAADAREPLKQAINAPNAQNLSDATLAVASPIAMAAGAYGLGKESFSPSVKPNVNPEVPPVTSPEASKSLPQEPITVPVPQGVKFSLRPGFEDAVTVNEDTKQIIIKDLQKFKDGVGSIDGPSGKLKEFSKDLKAAEPSLDYNEGYNPDAIVKSHVSGVVPTEEASANWINARAAAKWTGENVSKAFSDLDTKYVKSDTPTSPLEAGLAKSFDTQAQNLGGDSLGLEDMVNKNTDHPLVQLQDALKAGQEPEVERYMNQLHEEVRKAGIQDKQLQLGYQESYVPQMWENSPDEIADAFKQTKRIGIKPSFSMNRVFDDYRTGIEKGLTPKFDSPSQLIGSYASYVDKFVADKNYFDQLKTNGELKVRSQLTPDEYKNWEPIDTKRTPIQRFTIQDSDGTDVNISREYYAPKDLARGISEYLQGPDESSVLNKLGRGANQVKSLVMTSGIPGTALNIHGTNIGVGRMWQAGGADMVGRYLKYAVDPQKATNFTRNNLYDAPRFVRAGLKFNPEFTTALKPESETPFDTALRLKHNYLERPLFGQVIPALQLELAQTFEKGYVQRKVDPALATKLAAHDANTFVSNINYDELMRQRQIHDLGSALSFAPSWLESHYLIAKGAAKALLNPKDPTGYAYRQAASQVLKGMLAVGLINKATSGTFDPLTLHLGKDSKGKEQTLSPFGSGNDWIKIPVEIAQAAASGKPLSEISSLTKGRLSSPVQFLVDFLAKQKAQGGDLLRDRKGDLPTVFPQGSRNSQVQNLGELAVRTMAPGYVGSAIDAATGKGSGIKVGADILGAQMRTKNAPKVKAPF